MKIHPSLALALALITTTASAQRDFSNVEIKVIPVAKNIYMLEGSGGNIGVSIGSDMATPSCQIRDCHSAGLR
jgi:hypothetical protein